METPLEPTMLKTELNIFANLLAKETTHTLENTVLLGIVRVVFAGDFEDGREWVGECIYVVADALCNLWRIVLGSTA
jgi:hypothetical protein